MWYGLLLISVYCKFSWWFFSLFLPSLYFSSFTKTNTSSGFILFAFHWNGIWDPHICIFIYKICVYNCVFCSKTHKISENSIHLLLPLPFWSKTKKQKNKKKQTKNKHLKAQTMTWLEKFSPCHKQVHAIAFSVDFDCHFIWKLPLSQNVYIYIFVFIFFFCNTMQFITINSVSMKSNNNNNYNNNKSRWKKKIFMNYRINIRMLGVFFVFIQFELKIVCFG